MDDNYYLTLPKKSIASGVLFFNDHDELLIVKLTYKDHWGIPGGSVDLEESPYAAALREVKEELNLTLEKLELLAVDYIHLNGERGDWLQFIFDGGTVTHEQIAAIKLPPLELSDYKFCPVSEALQLLSDSTSKRVEICIEIRGKSHPLYLEDSVAVLNP